MEAAANRKLPSLERERTAGNALSQRKISSLSRVTWSRLLCELSKASSCRRSKAALSAALLPTFGRGRAERLCSLSVRAKLGANFRHRLQAFRGPHAPLEG